MIVSNNISKVGSCFPFASHPLPNELTQVISSSLLVSNCVNFLYVKINYEIGDKFSLLGGEKSDGNLPSSPGQ